MSRILAYLTRPQMFALFAALILWALAPEAFAHEGALGVLLIGSTQITTAFVQQYKSGVQMLVQQKGSRLRNAVRLETGIAGKTAFFDQIGATAARRRQTRHSDTPLIPTPHARRRVSLVDYDWADLIDQADKVRTLNDMSSPYQMNAANAMGRAQDDEIIANYFGTAYTGETGATTASFTAGNQIAAAATGLTLAKLLSAKEILDSGENDPDEERFIACAAKQMTNLLQTTEIKSADYNTVKALVKGEVDTFMGFKFIRTERLPVDGSSDRRVMCWRKSAMLLGLGQDMTARITEESTKNFATQVFTSMVIGATRMEEAGCVEIKCSE